MQFEVHQNAGVLVSSVVRKQEEDKRLWFVSLCAECSGSGLEAQEATRGKDKADVPQCLAFTHIHVVALVYLTGAEHIK